MFNIGDQVRVNSSIFVYELITLDSGGVCTLKRRGTGDILGGVNIAHLSAVPDTHIQDSVCTDEPISAKGNRKP